MNSNKWIEMQLLIFDSLNLHQVFKVNCNSHDVCTNGRSPLTTKKMVNGDIIAEAFP